jgi:predicted amidophosphoribosyltransferase
MARQKEDLGNLESCERCQGFLQDGAEQCPSCGKPTRFMSFKTRAEYEVEQWRRYKSDATSQAS